MCHIITWVFVGKILSPFNTLCQLYTVSQKRGDTILLSISLLNIDRFSQFFHRCTQLEIWLTVYISLQYKAEDTSCTAIPADWDGLFLPAAGSRSLVPPRQLLLKDVMLEPWNTAAAHRPPSLHPAVEQCNYRPTVIWVTTVGINWLIELCLMTPPTQYKLSGRQFYRSKDPTNSIKVLKEKTLQK